MSRSLRLLAALFALTLVVAACGDDETDVDTDLGAGGAAGACLEGAEECDDLGPPPAGDDMPAAGMCAEGVTDCDDTVEPGDGRDPENVVPADPAEGGTDTGQETVVPSDDRLRETAQSLLGTSEDELTDDVRVARRGEETFALTMDFRPGRMTVELDDDGSGTYVVVVVVVELSEQAETFPA